MLGIRYKRHSSAAAPSAAMSNSLHPLDERATKIFIHVALVSSLILQKIGILFGTSYLSLSMPVLGILIIWMLIRQSARSSKLVLGIYATFLFLVLVTTGINLVETDAKIPMSLPSLCLLLLLYLPLVVRPNSRFDSSACAKIFANYALFITIVGIIQYFVQFLGLKLNSIGNIIPFLKPILIENFYNSDPLLKFGSTTLRPNGVFLLEPSVYSQLIVVAASVELLILKRYKFLILYAIGYVLSYSGTGMICLAAAVILYSVISIKGAAKLPATILAGVVIFGVTNLIAPDIVASYASRIGEFGSRGSSAYARYVAQGRAWTTLLSDTHILYGYGPGSLAKLFPEVSSSAAIKLTVEYGAFTALTCFALVLAAIWDRKHGFIPLLFICQYQLGGGTELSPIFMIPMIIVCIWGRNPNDATSQNSHTLRQSGDNSTPSGRRSRHKLRTRRLLKQTDV